MMLTHGSGQNRRHYQLAMAVRGPMRASVSITSVRYGSLEATL